MPSSTSKSHARKPDLPELEGIARTTTRFQKREWVWQRAGWVALALFLLAGLAGVFGAGPLANVTVRNAAGEFEYQRFVRRHADTSWEFTLRGGSARDGDADVAIDAAFAKASVRVSISRAERPHMFVLLGRRISCCWVRGE